MKIYFLLFSFIFCTIECFAQIKAGEIPDVNKFNYRTDSVAIKYGDGHKTIDLKINKNSSIADLTIILDTFQLNCGSQSAKGTLIKIKNNTNIEILSTKYNAPSTFFNRARALNLNDSITLTSNNNEVHYWENNSVLISQARVITSDCSAGPIWDFNDFGSSPKYIGFRMNDGANYNYAWLELKSFVSYETAYIVFSGYYSDALTKVVSQDTVETNSIKINSMENQSLNLSIDCVESQDVEISVIDMGGNKLNFQKYALNNGHNSIDLPMQQSRNFNIKLLTITGKNWNQTLKFVY